MGEPVRISERDIRALLRIVTSDRDDDPADGLPWSLLADLSDQIPSDILSFVGLDSQRLTGWFGQGLPADDSDDDLEPFFWAHYWDCEPCSYPDRTGDLRSVTKLSDFYSARQWHATGMYSDYLRGVEHELMLSLPAGPGRTVRLIFFRGPGPDFSERDRALLALLRPHLREAYLDAEWRRRGVPDLTPRQRQLLRLVADGATNTQISRRLGISEGTVRTHMENIFERLQVSSRAAALAAAFPEHTAERLSAGQDLARAAPPAAWPSARTR
ncbi:MAG TPA: helix-turn-helix transcriptional regulator [Streptosporangiaceae bacterium]|nr:helix-turn-helix transcriptional regulator [Streptosporangiaceae bacterium]